MLLLAIPFNVDASISKNEKKKWHEKSILPIPKSHLYTTGDIEELVWLTVPNEYIEAFMYYSTLKTVYETNIFRIYLLGLGKMESEWVKTRSNKMNSNGTYDLGYLMLNENNIANFEFMNAYKPDEAFPPKDTIELYLIICINYFKYLYTQYSCDGLYAYNAGEKNYLRDKIPFQTYLYKYKIKQYVSEYFDTLYILAEKNYREKQRKYYEELENKLKNRDTKYRFTYCFNKEYDDTVTQDKCKTNYLIVPGLIYDPRKKIIEKLSLRHFVIKTLDNPEDIENALTSGA
jgi:hypothetical protein